MERARSRGQSLQAFLVSLVPDEARRPANLALLARFDSHPDGAQLSGSEVTDAVELVGTRPLGSRLWDLRDS